MIDYKEKGLLNFLERLFKKRAQATFFRRLLQIKNYVYLVPYVEEEQYIFLKTIIPSRQMNKKYNKGE
jgi:hypothetical protein